MKCPFYFLKVPLKLNEKSELEEAYKLGWTDTDIYEAANYTVRNLAVDLLLKAYKIDGQGAFA